MKGIRVRESESEGWREESSPSVYILFDSLAHGGSSMKRRHDNIIQGVMSAHILNAIMTW